MDLSNSSRYHKWHKDFFLLHHTQPHSRTPGLIIFKPHCVPIGTHKAPLEQITFEILSLKFA